MQARGSGEKNNSNVQVQYIKERKVLTATHIEPEEEEVKAAMKRDTAMKRDSLSGCANGGNKDIPEIEQKKADIDNIHILIDSDLSSDEVDDMPLSVQSTSTEILSNEVDDMSLSVRSTSTDILSSVADDMHLSVQSTSTEILSNSEVEVGDEAYEKCRTEQIEIHSTHLDVPSDPIPQHTTEETTSLYTTEELDIPAVNIRSEPSTSANIDSQTYHSVPPGQSYFDQQTTFLPSVQPDSQQILNPHTTATDVQPSDNILSGYDSELQQISAKLNNYNFGLDSDSDDDDNMIPDSGAIPTLKTEVRSNLQTISKPNEHAKVGTILKPVSTLCERECLYPPVLVVHHRPSDVISPWCCQLTVEDKYSSVGEGYSQREAIHLAAASIKSAMQTKKKCRQLKQQTDFLAHMFHHCCKLKKFSPPVYNIVHKSQDKVNITAVISGETLYSEKGFKSADSALSHCFEYCCSEMQAQVPGLPCWHQHEVDYRAALLTHHPDSMFSSNKVEENWFGEVSVHGRSSCC